MTLWTFKKEFYGSKKGKLDLKRVRDFLEIGHTLIPYTLIKGYFRTVYWDGGYNKIYRHIARPWPDLLIAQKPNHKFAMHLSGGFDSSILAYLYDSPNADYFHVRGPETDKAEAMGELLKGNLHILDVSSEEYIETAETVLGRYTEPECDAAGVLTYIASNEAKRNGHDLIITGDCADTILGGHTWGPHSEKAVDIWKTLEPNNLLGLKTLMPFGHPGLKAWVKTTLSPELVDYNKTFLRQYARQIGLPDIITQQNKMGWGGCWEFANSTIVKERMQSAIHKSKFEWLQKIVHYKREYSLFRLYALVLWLDNNYSGEYTNEKDYASHFFKRDTGYPESSPFVEIYAKQRIRPKIQALQKMKKGRLILFGTEPHDRALLFYMKENDFQLPDIIVDCQSSYKYLCGVPILEFNDMDWLKDDLVVFGTNNDNDATNLLLESSNFRGNVINLQYPLSYSKTNVKFKPRKNIVISSVELLPTDSKVVIYGAGEAGRHLQQCLLEYRKDIEIQCFVDSYKQGEFCGKDLLKAAVFFKNIESFSFDYIIIASMFYEEIEDILNKKRIVQYFNYRPSTREKQLSIDPKSDNYRRLKSLKNIHKHNRCFVIGNGPSLRVSDLDKLTSEITFASNKIHLAFNQTKWRPNYYYADHHEIIEEDLEAINAFPESICKFFPTRILDRNIRLNKALYFELVWDVFYPNEPKFSISALDRLYWGSNVTFTLLQLAGYLGIREIYLLGVDCKFIAPPGYENGDKKFEVTEEMKCNHFHPEYSKVGSLVFPPNVERHLLSYRSARFAMERLDGKIFNATRGGDLEVFERIDFDSLF